MNAKAAWARCVTGILVAGGCSCGGPVSVQVPDGSTYATPQEAGVINTKDGTEFEFNSTAGGMTAVVRFQVPATRTYEVRYGGRDLFEICIRLSQMTASLVTFEHEVWRPVSLDAATDYFLEIEQVDAAKMGATVVTIRDG